MPDDGSSGVPDLTLPCRTGNVVDWRATFFIFSQGDVDVCDVVVKHQLIRNEPVDGALIRLAGLEVDASSAGAVDD